MVCITAARSGLSKTQLHRVYIRKGVVCRVALNFTDCLVKPVKFERLVVGVIKREPFGRTTVVAMVSVRRDGGELTPKIFRVHARVRSSVVVVGGRWVNVWRVGKWHRSCVIGRFE